MSDPNLHEYLVSCSCRGHHFMAFRWSGDDALRDEMTVEGYLDAGGDFRTTWKRRLAMAWDILRGGCADTMVGVIVNHSQARELAAELLIFSGAARPPYPPEYEPADFDDTPPSGRTP